MKKKLPYYIFLFALYSPLTLYGRFFGLVHPTAIVRPLFTSLVLAFLLTTGLQLIFNSIQRAAILSAFLILILTTSGTIYRLFASSILPGSPFVHLGIVITGIVLSLVFFHPAVWKKYLPKRRLQSLTSNLNLFSVLLLLVPFYNITQQAIKDYHQRSVPWNSMLPVIQSPKSAVDSKDKRDIYYIILDGYSRQDVLKDVYGYDNSDFINYLRTNGFTVLDKGQSNYTQTAVSLSSSLNMDYINFAAEQAGHESDDYLPLFNLFRRNRVRQILEGQGYQTVSIFSDYFFTSWDDAKFYYSPFRGHITELEEPYYATTAFSLLYEFETPITPFLRNILPLASYGKRRATIQYIFSKIPEIAKLPSPKFVFIHLIIPHPPFVLDENGDAITTNYPYSPGDGATFQGTPEEYKLGYIKQVQYVNARMKDVIQQILSTSTSQPIIIIQGDHGGGLNLTLSPQTSCLWERFSILNAIYPSNDALYESMTPVNTFRVIMNSYLKTNYNLLPDRHFFSPLGQPYNFTEITNIAPQCP
jgi:hypothetical protein